MEDAERDKKENDKGIGTPGEEERVGRTFSNGWSTRNKLREKFGIKKRTDDIQDPPNRCQF